MPYEIRLDGDENILEVLTEVTRNKDPMVIKKSNGYFLDSRSFLDLNSASDIVQVANKHLANLNGSAKLVLGEIKPVRIAGGNFENEERKKHIFGVSSTIMIYESLHQAKTDDTQRISSWLVAAQNDENILKVVLLSNNNADWVNLYRIYEVMRDDVGGDKKLCALCGVSRGKLENFSRTSHHPKATGLAARHGSLSSEPPANPMPLEEAQLLIKAIINCWFVHKTSTNS